MNEKDLISWCSLWRAPGVGSKTFYRLVAQFGTPQAFFSASLQQLQQLFPNIDVAKLRGWQSAKNSGEQDVAWLAADPRHHIITLENPLYPPLLKHLDDAPPLLFVCGEAHLLSRRQIAIVGSRNATPLAMQTCTHFACELTKRSLIVSSGMALGIDSAAHRGALQEGATIAVVATGLDRVYPAANRQLAHEISKNGVLVSEFPIGVGVRSGNFPRRNRLISAMSVGVLVIEASLQSGSLITAKLAAEQGKDVFAIPGSIHNPLARGCHYLIKQGAKLVESIDDILAEYEILQGEIPTQDIENKEPNVKKMSDLPTEQFTLLQQMAFDIYHLDDLIMKSQLTSEEISATLSLLELDGWVVSLSGGRYQRAI